MRFYIASSLGNAAAVRLLAKHLVDKGHEHTYDWTQHGSVQSEGVERMREVAENEIQGVRGAEVVIVLLPGGRGTHVELGVALGCNVSVLLVGTEKQLGDETGRHCAFYHANAVKILGNVGQVLPELDELSES